MHRNVVHIHISNVYRYANKQHINNTEQFDKLLLMDIPSPSYKSAE